MVSPKSINYLRCHKKMGGAAKNLVEQFDQEGLPTGKVATKVRLSLIEIVGIILEISDLKIWMLEMLKQC
jgi:hypothetical protein